MNSFLDRLEMLSMELYGNMLGQVAYQQGRSQPFERVGAILKFAKLVTSNNLEN